MSDIIVTIDDVISAGFCVKGTRRWFANYGLDFKVFLDSGMSSTALAATGDAYALAVIETARRRVGAEDG